MGGRPWWLRTGAGDELPEELAFREAAIAEDKGRNVGASVTAEAQAGGSSDSPSLRSRNRERPTAIGHSQVGDLSPVVLRGLRHSPKSLWPAGQSLMARSTSSKISGGIGQVRQAMVGILLWAANPEDTSSRTMPRDFSSATLAACPRKAVVEVLRV